MKKDNETDNLILGQTVKPGEQTEQMKFDDSNSRPSPDVQNDLTNKQTSFSNKVDFPEPTEEYSTYEELLASAEYKHALDKLREFTGETNIGTGFSGKMAELSNNAMRILSEVMRAEGAHKEELSRLCERLVRSYIKMPENALAFDFKLVGQISVKNKQKKEELKQKEEELAEDINDLTPERASQRLEELMGAQAKRRLINSMTQGHSVNAAFLHQNVERELEEITGLSNIAEKYSIMFATMLLNYWQMDNAQIGSTGGDEDEGQGAGKMWVDTTTRPPVVHAEALSFPFLVHEAIKGVMEFLGKERNPENPETYQTAKDLEDHIQHETWDMRLGPEIWRRLLALFPESVIQNEELRKLQYYMYGNICNLPVKEFLLLMKEVMGGTETGKNLLGALYYDLSRKINNEPVSKGDSEFRRLMDELKSNSEDFDINDMLNELGISTS